MDPKVTATAGTAEAAALLKAVFRDAVVERTEFWVGANIWTLTQRTANGPNTVDCTTEQLESTVARLIAGAK